MTTYTKQDSIDSLSAEQLELMARSQNDILIYFIEERTHFDAHRIRLLLELGCIEATRRLDAMRQTPQLIPGIRNFRWTKRAAMHYKTPETPSVKGESSRDGQPS